MKTLDPKIVDSQTFDPNRNPTLETLKSRAKIHARRRGIPHMAALDEIACPFGYPSWARLAAAARNGRVVLPPCKWLIYADVEDGEEVRQRVFGSYDSVDEAALAFRALLEKGELPDFIMRVNGAAQASNASGDIVATVALDPDYQLYLLDLYDAADRAIRPVLYPHETLSASLRNLLASGHRAMARKYTRGAAIDVADRPQPARGLYLLEHFETDKDYCDTAKQQWIFSIGRHRLTGDLLAATDSRFYQHPEYECLFLR